MDLIQHHNYWKDDAIKNLILDGELDFKFIKGGTTGVNYPGLAHTLVDRVENIDKYEKQEDRILSKYWESHFGELFYAFTRRHMIPVERVCRAAVNLTTHAPYEHGEPHIDHYFPHKLFLYAINAFDGGETILFDKRADNGDPNKLTVVPPIGQRVHMEQGKAICFDGDIYHANAFTAPGQYRLIFVVSFY